MTEQQIRERIEALTARMERAAASSSFDADKQAALDAEVAQAWQEIRELEEYIKKVPA